MLTTSEPVARFHSRGGAGTGGRFAKMIAQMRTIPMMNQPRLRDMFGLLWGGGEFPLGRRRRDLLEEPGEAGRGGMADGILTAPGGQGLDHVGHVRDRLLPGERGRRARIVHLLDGPL